MNIFGYYNYRTYLKDYYEYKKSVNRHFSYRKFAERAGLKSASVFRDIMTGRRNFTLALVPKFVEGMNLEGSEVSYLELMIDFTHANSHEVKQEIFEQMSKMLPKSAQKLDANQRAYFENWYHIATREALSVLDVDDNYHDLAYFLSPKVSRTKVKRTIALLSNLKLIEKRGGFWRSCNASIQGDHIDPFIVHQLQKQFMDLAKESLAHYTKEKRNISHATISVSNVGITKIKSRIDACRKEVISIVAAETNVNQVYQFNMQFFPLSKEFES